MTDQSVLVKLVNTLISCKTKEHLEVFRKMLMLAVAQNKVSYENGLILINGLKNKLAGMEKG